jgi:hypothetical protein
LLILAVLLVVAVLIVLLTALLRRLEPEANVWLHIAPAASTIDEATTIHLSSGGWRRGEQVAICLGATADQDCGPEGALSVEIADIDGNIQSSVRASEQLAQGRMTFLVQGLESQRGASRSFRVLRAPGAPLISASVTTPVATGAEVDRTPTPGLQTPDMGLPAAGGRWRAEYFSDPDLAGQPVVVREETELLFDWGAGSPAPQLPPDGFSARWQQRLTFPGVPHRFLIQADGGVRLYVDGALLIDRWQDDGAVTSASASIDLVQGEHDLRVEYFDQRGNASVVLRWEAGDQFPDWRGEYFTNPDLAGQPALVRNDPDPNLDWGVASPVPGVIPSDGFSVRWTRSLDFAPGVYRFVLTAESGARLLIEGDAVIDAWQGAAGQTITADQTVVGGRYEVILLYRNVSGPASIRIGWSPLLTPTPIQLAGVEPAATPGILPTPEPAPPGSTPTLTATPGTGTPGATETVSPTLSVTASLTETTVVSNGTDTPEPTPGTPTATPTLVTPPGSVERSIEVNPPAGPPGRQIRINSVNWTPGTLLRVALGQFGQPYTEAVNLSGVSFTTPTDSSQPWSFQFAFPDDPDWLSQTLPVQIWVHNSGWTEWSKGEFRVETP